MGVSGIWQLGEGGGAGLERLRDGRAHAHYNKCVGEPRGATCGVLLAACRFTCPPTSPLVPVEARFTASTVSGRVELEVDTPLPTCPKQLTQQFVGRHQMGAISGAGTSGFRLPAADSTQTTALQTPPEGFGGTQGSGSSRRYINCFHSKYIA